MMTEAEIVEAMDEAYLNTTPHGDAMCAAYHVAREQTLREAATEAKVAWLSCAYGEIADADAMNQVCEHAEAKILALIPSHPSQEP